MNKNMFLALALLLSATGSASAFWGWDDTASDNKDKAVVVKEAADAKDKKEKNEAALKETKKEANPAGEQKPDVKPDQVVPARSLTAGAAGVLAAPFALLSFTAPVADIIKNNPGYTLLAAAALALVGGVVVYELLQENDEDLDAERIF